MPEPQRSDADLVRAVLQGDRDAYAHLIQRYQTAVRAAAHARLPDTHCADDAAQDAFVTAYARLGSLRKPESFGPWLLRIARRSALRHARLQRRGAAAPLDPHPLESPASGNGRLDPDTHELLAAIARLPPHESAVVTLRYIEGHPVQTIADLTGRPVGTVTKQLSRALRRLRRRLGSE